MKFARISFLILSLTVCSHAFTTTPRPLAPRISKVAAPLKESQGPPGYPNIIAYPKNGWGLSKPKPKKSLVDLGTEGSAAAWILNLIEFAHWVSFAIGFHLFWTMFNNIDKLGTAIKPGDPIFGVFFLMFAHVTQVYGGGISGNMMHQYEGWQVAEFRNPLKLDSKGDKEPAYNDAWLRAVAYQMLFSFQTLGVLFTWIGINGVTKARSKAVIVLTAFAISLAPQLPHCTSVFPRVMNVLRLEKLWSLLTNGNRPVFPLSIWIFIAFLLNSFLATGSYVKMFGNINWVGVPILQSLPKQLAAVIPFLLIAFGGIYEGLRAETSFNQWDHFIAFVMLDTGLALHIPYYLRLIA